MTEKHLSLIALYIFHNHPIYYLGIFFEHNENCVSIAAAPNELTFETNSWTTGSHWTQSQTIMSATSLR